MNKKILVLALTFASTNVLAGSYFSKHVSTNDTIIEASIGNYTLEADGLEEEKEMGFKISLDHKSHRNLGIEASIENAKFEGGSLQIARFGMNMNIIDHYKEFDLKASVGAFSTDIEGLSDTNFYIGLTFEGELIPRKLSGEVFIRRYNLDREHFSENQMGGQLNYHLDRNMNVFIAAEQAGDVGSVSVGVGYKF